ncbi:hypothetical protein SALBM217S_09217 [Streptomyces griseoloalbus]
MDGDGTGPRLLHHGEVRSDDVDLALAPETLARWQFGITTVYHFLFVPLTISLAALVAGLQTAWVRTENVRPATSSSRATTSGSAS